MIDVVIKKKKKKKKKRFSSGMLCFLGSQTLTVTAVYFVCVGMDATKKLKETPWPQSMRSLLSISKMRRNKKFSCQYYLPAIQNMESYPGCVFPDALRLIVLITKQKNYPL